MTTPISKLSACLLFSFSITSYAETQLDVDLDSDSELNSRSGFYLGLDLATSITGEITATSSFDDSEDSADIDTSTVGLFVGYRTESNNRIQLSRTSISVDYESGVSEDVTGTELDFHYVYGKELVQPYVGFGFGLHTLEDSGDYMEDGEDLNGFSFQLLGGVKLDVHEHLELDLSYRVKSIAWDDLVYFDGFGVETIQISHSYSSLNFGAAFMF